MSSDPDSSKHGRIAAVQATQKPDSDAPVTLKVNYEGLTRRHKLSLRDMGVSMLEPKVRELLKVSDDTELSLERYSDSAGAYISLDSNNISVYKQLYRAAKAKHKLKLRVVRTNQPEHQDTSPNVARVEDVPENATVSSAISQEQKPEFNSLPSDIFDVLKGASSQHEPDAFTKQELPSTDTGFDFETSLLASMMKRQANIGDTVKEEPIPDLSSTRTPPVLHGSQVRDTRCGRASRSTGGLCPARLPGYMNFAVCCNSCDETIPGSHYHCSTCDDGDFDLCHRCVDQGITCHSDSHWLIKRVVNNGRLVTSTTETLAPKRKKGAEPASRTGPTLFESKTRADNVADPLSVSSSNLNNNPLSIRTCNCCVHEFPESSFLHCTACEDFDLCQSCFVKDSHGHNPRHAFVPAVEGSQVASHIQVRLAPGRNQIHNAICDGCDKYVSGVRHKCLDCPDWDYCGDCIVNAKKEHSGHRFVPIYEPLEEIRSRSSGRQVHHGICCDGPHCNPASGSSRYITGVRYKCAVCHDVDFCANCEASPVNLHNQTHPLIKFKTPVRHVSVNTTGERGDGQRMPMMGDRTWQPPSPRSPDSASIADVQTVVDVKPVEPTPRYEDAVEKKLSPQASLEIKKEGIVEKSAPTERKAPTEKDLVAVFVSDTITDGTMLPPNHAFQQTWVLRNEGEVAWPSGCAVKFVGGDFMGHVDSNQPAGISELVSASESTICYEGLAPGQEFPFTVLLRTPAREGKLISYWRLTSEDGIKFGHRLWCDINVQAQSPAMAATEKAPHQAKKVIPDTADEHEPHYSQMVFPKLETESPESSVHEETKSQVPSAHVDTDVTEEVDGFEDCDEFDEWDGSDDGFLTDEEYDVLDASDEEYLQEQQKRLQK